MGWSSWLTGSDGSSSKTKTESSGGAKKTHYLSTAGKGGSKRNHSHVVVQEKGGRKTAQGIPHKDNRKR